MRDSTTDAMPQTPSAGRLTLGTSLVLGPLAAGGMLAVVNAGGLAFKSGWPSADLWWTGAAAATTVGAVAVLLAIGGSIRGAETRLELLSQPLRWHPSPQ